LLLKKLFEGRPDLTMLEKHLERQIDAGVLPHQTFRGYSRFGRIIHALVAHPGLPDHAWIDAQKSPPLIAENLRAELIAAGLLAPIERPPDDKSRTLRRVWSMAACEHSPKACQTCRAQRRIEVAFQDFPALWPLRDRFIDQLQRKIYRPRFFGTSARTLWPLIGELGKAPFVTHEWFDALRRQDRDHRCVRSELIACGLLPPLLDHPGVGRFRAIAATMLSAVAWTDEQDRRLVERFLRMHLMSRLRKGLSGKADRDYQHVNLVQSYLREILVFTTIVESAGRTFRDFTKADILSAWGTRSHGLKALLQWFAKEGIGQERFIPKRRSRDDGYGGIGTPAVRANVAMLLELDAQPSLRLAGILSYCGVLGTQIASLRASDVLPNGDIMIAGSIRHMHAKIAELAIALQQSLLEQVRERRPVGWDPWLFAPADALEAPAGTNILEQLRKLGIEIRAMRTDGQRISSQRPMEAYALGKNMKRGRRTTMKHLKVFASEAGAYAILLANEKLIPS
jgi:hypothetical protein